jgi:hypothetical protein
MNSLQRTIRARTAGGILLAAALAAGMLRAQGVGAAPGQGSASAVTASHAGEDSVEVLKVIADPHTGTRWLLLRDLSHPGGPGRLVPAGELPANLLPSLRADATGAAAQPDALQVRPVIHTGDRLIVEEHTAVVDASLEAVALSAALPGAAFDVRLKWGGKVLRVWAAGPGRAMLQPPSEVKP